jgi:CheY-like chemotaxis protein
MHEAHAATKLAAAKFQSQVSSDRVYSGRVDAIGEIAFLVRGGAMPNAQNNKPVVLVVEDDLVVASAMRMLFERRGWRVLHAADLAQAKAQLSPPPQWVVLDLMLPDGDGTELLREMKRQGLPSKTVVTTGVVEPNHLKAVEEYQPTAILHKPTSFGRILEAMGVATPQ